MNKRWLFVLLLVPLALAVPLVSAASWRPHSVGVHPIRGKALPPFAPGTLAPPPQFRLMMAPDGARLLSISTEAKPSGLAMWEARGERVLWTKPQADPMEWQPRSFSPDGKTLLVVVNPSFSAKPRGAAPTMLVLLDAASGAPIAQFPLNSREYWLSINDAAFARDGRQLVAATNEELLVWDVATRREISRTPIALARPPKSKNASAFVTLAPGGEHYIADWTYFVSATLPKSWGSEVRDLSGQVLWQKLGARRDFFYFSPDGTLLLSVESFDTYQVFDAKTGRSLWKKKLAGAGIARQWRPDSRAVAVQVGNEIQFREAQTGRVTRKVALADAQDFAIAPSGDQLYSIDAEGQITRQRLR